MFFYKTLLWLIPFGHFDKQKVTIVNEWTTNTLIASYRNIINKNIMLILRALNFKALVLKDSKKRSCKCSEIFACRFGKWTAVQFGVSRSWNVISFVSIWSGEKVKKGKPFKRQAHPAEFGRIWPVTLENSFPFKRLFSYPHSRKHKLVFDEIIS